ncbi:hypothetical protein [Tatumella sp. UBA2305]|uniref:hypothetical protein n=1 Tax=Tatumella sp. UBA2305 TaxID=1947647 RepID=UPI0025F05F3B|nr:hypothetical protein [Tatumella sp. UBA2305]
MSALHSGQQTNNNNYPPPAGVRFSGEILLRHGQLCRGAHPATAATDPLAGIGRCWLRSVWRAENATGQQISPEANSSGQRWSGNRPFTGG